MLLLLSNRRDLGHFRFSYFVCIHAAQSFAPGVNLEHNPRRIVSLHAEHGLQHFDHELHWRVIVVYQHNVEQGWLLQPRPRLRHSQVMAVLIVEIGFFWLNVAHKLLAVPDSVD